MSACESQCDCGRIGLRPHEPECASFEHCNERQMCDKHARQAEAEYAWMRGKSKGACTGVMSEQDKQDLRHAGRGHLVCP